MAGTKRLSSPARGRSKNRCPATTSARPCRRNRLAGPTRSSRSRTFSEGDHVGDRCRVPVLRLGRARSGPGCAWKSVLSAMRSAGGLQARRRGAEATRTLAGVRDGLASAARRRDRRRNCRLGHAPDGGFRAGRRAGGSPSLRSVAWRECDELRAPDVQLGRLDDVHRCRGIGFERKAPARPVQGVRSPCAALCRSQPTHREHDGIDMVHREARARHESGREREAAPLGRSASGHPRRPSRASIRVLVDERTRREPDRMRRRLQRRVCVRETGAALRPRIAPVRECRRRPSSAESSTAVLDPRGSPPLPSTIRPSLGRFSLSHISLCGRRSYGPAVYHSPMALTASPAQSVVPAEAWEMLGRTDLEAYTSWDFPSHAAGHPDAGDASFNGVTPAGCVANLVRRYSGPGDLVVDPMAGSGTIGDVARALGRRAVSFDLVSRRPHILRADARAWPVPAETAALAVIDSPYSDNVAYSTDPRCLGRISCRDARFYDEMEKVALEAHRVLRPGGVLGWIIADEYRGGRYTSVGFRLLSVLERRFEPIDTIVLVRHHDRSASPMWEHRARRFNFYLRGFKFLFLLRKPVAE